MVIMTNLIGTEPDSVKVTSSLSLYFCCSYVEHGASVKRFVSLQFLNLRHSVGLLGRGISPS
jgi:hypothetical protein